MKPPARRLVGLAGFALALALHAAVAWTVLGGSARETVQTLRAPIIVSLLEAPPEPRPAPAAEPVPERPAPTRREPPARVVRPAQPVVQPQADPPVRAAAPVPVVPEPAVAAPMPTAAPPSAAGPPSPPSSEPVLAAAAPAPPSPMPAQARPTVSAGVVCANFRTAMGDAAFPREALRKGLDKGEALVEFTLGAAGQIRDVKAVSASHPVFARSSMRIVQALECAGQGRDLVVQVPFNYRLE